MLCISTSFAVSPSQLYTFTASQLPYSDRGWVLNRAQRQRSCNAPLGIRHAMTIQRRLQRCPKMIQTVHVFDVFCCHSTSDYGNQSGSRTELETALAFEKDRIVMGRDGS